MTAWNSEPEGPPDILRMTDAELRAKGAEWLAAELARREARLKELVAEVGGEPWEQRECGG